MSRCLFLALPLALFGLLSPLLADNPPRWRPPPPNVPPRQLAIQQQKMAYVGQLVAQQRAEPNVIWVRDFVIGGSDQVTDLLRKSLLAGLGAKGKIAGETQLKPEQATPKDLPDPNGPNAMAELIDQAVKDFPTANAIVVSGRFPLNLSKVTYPEKLKDKAPRVFLAVGAEPLGLMEAFQRDFLAGVAVERRALGEKVDETKPLPADTKAVFDLYYTWLTKENSLRVNKE